MDGRTVERDALDIEQRRVEMGGGGVREGGILIGQGERIQRKGKSKIVGDSEKSSVKSLLLERGKTVIRIYK